MTSSGLVASVVASIEVYHETSGELSRNKTTIRATEKGIQGSEKCGERLKEVYNTIA